MKKFLLMLLGVLMTLPAFARDFEYEYKGQTLTYTVISEEDKTCIPRAGHLDVEANTITTGNYPLSGNLIIPEVAKDGEVEYLVTAIPDCAFSFTQLDSISIPASVTSIGNYAFYFCDNMVLDTIPSSVTSIGNYAFAFNSSQHSVTIPNSVTSLGDGAFYYCQSLTLVTIGNSVTSIGSSTFEECCNLTSVTIPNSVTSIGSSAFKDCNMLTSVTIPNSVTSIGSSAFAGCYGLNSVTIPESVTSIGSSVFEDCWNLTSITIPNSLTTIGGYAFSNCHSLTSVTIPESVTSIGESAFINCHALTKAEFASVESMCKIQYYNTYSNPLAHAHNLWIEGKEVKDLVIPESVTSIGDYAFNDCSALTSVTISTSVTSIGDYAFYGCSALTSVVIPTSVASIGVYAFMNCIGLTSVYYGADNPITGDKSIFGNTPYKKATLYMSEKGMSKGALIDPWKNFENIQAYDFSGIEEITTDIDADSPYEVYNLNGVKVADSTDGLAPGLYIIRQGNTVKKIAVE